VSSEGRPRSAVEVHSIDYVPLNERHGKAWHQGPFWFAGNFVLVTVATGFIGPSLGLSAGWSILAVLTGVLFGTCFVAFHANQGPRLGLPQMIQSRAQFGSRGALFPLLAALFIYIGFSVFNIIVAAESLDTVVHLSSTIWYIVLLGVAALIAIWGHDVLHFIQRWLTFFLIVVFGVFTVYALTSVHRSAAGHHGFTSSAFIAQFGACAAFQITYAVFVSDYSRYLPQNVSAKGVIGWTYLGMAASAIWLMCLGVFLGSKLAATDPVVVAHQVGNHLFSGFGTFMVVISVPGLISITAVEIYGGTLTSLSAIDAFKHVEPTRAVRVVGILIITAAVLALALVIPSSFLTNFNTFLTLCLDFLVPWTAINLVDFYFVRRGHYQPLELLKTNGKYGRWAWRGMAAYLPAVAAMVPFVDVSFYTGPIAKQIGSDIAFVVGLAVASGLYLIISKAISPYATAPDPVDHEQLEEPLAPISSRAAV
jgi:NCS1 family nucleobase:cation symporter-1